MRSSALISLLTTSLALFGCAVGPDFESPSFATPEAYARQELTGSETQPVLKPGLNDTIFWAAFNDEYMTLLIKQVLAENKDLQRALANYDRSNALLKAAKFDYIPTITAQAEAGEQKLSQSERGTDLPRSSQRYGVQINASWELDLWGRVRREVESAQANSEATHADLIFLQITLVGEAANSYVQLRGLQERLRIAQQSANGQLETLKLVQARYSAGKDTNYELALAKAQHEMFAARIPPLEAQIATLEHRIAVLAGLSPGALIEELNIPKTIPTIPPPIDPGTPADLLRRRPDIVAAEARLHAATAQIGVATADLFPKLSLTSLLGTQSLVPSGLFDSGRSAIFLGIDWSFLDVGRVRARIAASRADAAALLAQYQQTVLLALEETENALIYDSRTRRENALLKRAAQDSEEAVLLARIRYQAGIIDLQATLDAERRMLAAQDAYADSHTRSATASLSLYKALAGGWPLDTNTSKQLE